MSDRLARFAALQDRLRGLPTIDDSGRDAPVTVVAVSSVDLGPAFNERNDLPSLDTRWLYLILLLRRPAARVVLVTSDEVPPGELRYYLELGAIPSEARSRLLLVSLKDLRQRPLTDKLLENASALERIRSFVGDQPGFIAPFRAGAAEHELAMALQLPIQGIDSRFVAFGTKTGSRRLFHELGIPAPRGEEGLRGAQEVAAAIARLRALDPRLAEVVIKHDEGTTGSGNAIVDLEGLPLPGHAEEVAAIERRIASLPSAYRERLAAGAVVEEVLRAATVRSPSAQARIRGDGEVSVISTHEQILGGPFGHTYTGCRFPADPSYARLIAAAAERIGEALAARGAVGRFAVDFLVTRSSREDWRCHALEINLREGGTTHPHGALVLLAGGEYERARARFVTDRGRMRCYRATDAMTKPSWRGLGSSDLLAAVAGAGIAYDAGRETGVVFLMLRSLAREGRLGLVAIGEDQGHCDRLFDLTEQVVDELSARRDRDRTHDNPMEMAR